MNMSHRIFKIQWLKKDKALICCGQYPSLGLVVIGKGCSAISPISQSQRKHKQGKRYANHSRKPTWIIESPKIKQCPQGNP